MLFKLLTTVPIIDTDRDGVSVSVASLSKALYDLGIALEVVTAGNLRGLSIPPVNIFRVPAIDIRSIRLYVAPRYRQQLQERILSFKPNIIHDHGLWGPLNWNSTRLAIKNEIPLVISTRGTLTTWALKYKGLKKKLVWNFFQKDILCAAQLLHATSFAEAEQLRQIGLSNPIAVIPNAIELPTGIEFSADRTSNPTEKIALFLSRIHPVKGLLNLIQAWHLSRPVGWRLSIVGPNENGHRSEVERLVNDLGMSGVIDFVGAVTSSEKWDYYRRANLFILPSHSENFGLVIAEALASGLPVITTQNTPWKALQEHQCGWWINADMTSLAEAISQATSLTNSQLTDMGRRGIALIKNDYQWESAAQKMIKAYQWVLGNEHRPDFII